MVQLQHRHRREGSVTVGKTRYDLNDQGVVEVTEEHAARMLQGAAWRKVSADGSMPWPEAPPAPPMKHGAAGRRPRTREELLGLADTQGIPPPEEGPKGFDQRGRIIKPEPKEEETPEPSPVLMTALRDSPPAPPVPTEPAEETAEETIEVSMDMTKSQLAEVCGQLEIEVPKSATKAQLLELIQQQSGD